MRPRSLAVLVLVLLAGCGGDGFPPPIEICDTPGPPVATALTVGRAGDGAFAPLEEFDIVDIEIGEGGLPYLGVRLRVAAAGDLACLGQETRLVDENGNTAAIDDTPTPTYDLGDGTRATHTMWILVQRPPDPGNPVRLFVTAGGQALELRLTAP
jgi:hypothetical protein